MHVGDVRWKSNLARKAAEAFFQRQRMKLNLADIVYNNTNNSEMFHVSKFDVFYVPYFLLVGYNYGC